MNRRIIRSIDDMRLECTAPTAIANALGVSVNTVKSHIRRHPVIPGTLNCMCCGRPVAQAEGRKQKKFCSDKCRNRHWRQTQGGN